MGTRTRENDQWVHITATNAATTAPNGWILMSGLTTAQAPIADNAIQINLVDPSNNNNVVKSITITRNGATKGTNFGYLDGSSNWTISSSDRSSIQNQIRSALNGTSYGLDSLSTAQIAQIAQTNFGSSVNLTVNKIANIADNAIRINFVKPDGTTLKSTDWVKSGAPKGANVGFSPSGNTLWTFYSGDQSLIQNQVNSALSGTGFQVDTNSNTLTANQIDTIARGAFGGQVYINVVPVASATSTVTPYIWDSGAGTSSALTPISSSSVTTKVKLDNATAAFNDVPSNVTKDIVQQIVNHYVRTAGSNASNTVKQNAAIDGVNYVNQQIYNASLNEYALSNLNFNGFKGQSGNKWAITDLTASLVANNLWTIHSPSYPLFTINDQNEVQAPTTTSTTYSFDPWNTGLTLTGTYGNPAKVVYDPSPVTQLPHVTAPAN